MESEMAQLANPQISASSQTVGRTDRRPFERSRKLKCKTAAHYTLTYTYTKGGRTKYAMEKRWRQSKDFQPGLTYYMHCQTVIHLALFVAGKEIGLLGFTSFVRGTLWSCHTICVACYCLTFMGVILWKELTCQLCSSSLDALYCHAPTPTRPIGLNLEFIAKAKERTARY